MNTYLQQARSALADSGLSPAQRRRTDLTLTTVLGVSFVALSASYVVLGDAGVGEAGPYLLGASGLLLAWGVLTRSGGTRATVFNLALSAQSIAVLALPLVIAQAVALLALAFCLATLYRDILRWLLTVGTSTLLPTVLAARSPHWVFGDGHRHATETFMTLAAHSAMFLEAAMASGVVWLVLWRARAAEQDARHAQEAVLRLLPPLSAAVSATYAEAPVMTSLGDLSRRALSRIEELSSLNQRFMDSVEEAVLTVNVDGAVLHANPPACALWGRQGQDLVGCDVGGLLLVPWTLLLTPDGVPMRTRTTAIRADGQAVPVQAVVTGLVGEMSERGYMVSVVDLTDRLAAQEAELARERMDTQRQYALELNDTVVQGLTVAAYAGDAGDYDELVVMVRQTLERAREMVGALLDSEDALAADRLRRTTAAQPHIVSPVQNHPELEL